MNTRSSKSRDDHGATARNESPAASLVEGVMSAGSAISKTATESVGKIIDDISHIAGVGDGTSPKAGAKQSKFQMRARLRNLRSSPATAAAEKNEDDTLQNRVYTRKIIEQASETTENNDHPAGNRLPLDVISGGLDISAILAVVVSIAAASTIRRLDFIRESNIPLDLAIPWLFMAYILGYWSAGYKGHHEESGEECHDSVPTNQVGRRTSLRREPSTAMAFASTNENSNGNVNDDEADGTIFRGMLKRFNSNSQARLGKKRHTIRSVKERVQRMRNERPDEPRLMKRLMKRSGSSVSPKSTPPSSQNDIEIDPTEGKPKKRGQHTSDKTVKMLELQHESNQTSGAEYAMGSYALEDPIAATLGERVELEPLLKLRGIDVFLTDDPEEEIGTHPFLIKNGLRSVPTFIVNLMTQWGNMIMYFEMPVEDLGESLVEKDDDSDPVRSLKRFLSGDDSYRRRRIKVITSFAHAPLPIRAMAPTGELILQRDGLVETTYSMHENGPDECPTVELTLNLMGNRAIRGMSSLVKKYSSKIVIDLAAVVSKPAGQTEDEPMACLGLWRLSHLDVNACPSMPDRYGDEQGSADHQGRDMRRASKMIELSKRQLGVKLAEF